VDILTSLFGVGVFNFWVVKITIGAAILGAGIYGFFLHKHEKKDKKLGVLLPDFLIERQVLYEKMAAKDPEFQTFCHECRHFDLNRLRCLLVLHDRKVRIKLNDDHPLRYCLYWNLDEHHPVMQLTERLKATAEDTWSAADGVRNTEKPGMKHK
jgi:hypothetical protein